MTWTDGPRAFAVLLAPAVIALTALTALPLLAAIWTSLQRWDLGAADGPELIGLGNYAQLLRDGAFWKAAGLTAYQVVGTVTLQIVIGLAFALLLSRAFRGASFLRSVYLIPMMSTPVVVGLLWKMLLNTNDGAVNRILGLVGIGPIDWLGSPALAMPSVILTDVWLSTPFVVIILTAGLHAIPGEVLEASRVDGASGWQQLRYVVLPMIRPMLVLAILFRTMDAVKRFDSIYVMTGGGPGNATETLDLHAFFYAFQYQDAGKAAAMAMIMLGIVMAISALLLRYVRPAT